jgi:ABC-type multidrug transport system ATPase subunit
MIATQGLTKQLGGRRIVSDVSFRCEPGTVTGFLGPNGAGKTTTMRMLVGLDEAAARRRVGQYSLGMRQRLGFAHALLGDPEVLILDEPANGLDPERMRWMRRVLREFADRGGTVLLSSHLLAEVEAVADRMIIIGDGRIQALGTRAELLTHSGTLVEAADLATLDAALARAGLANHPVKGDRRLVESRPEAIARLAMANDIVLRRLTPAEDTGLEHLFLELTGASAWRPRSRSPRSWSSSASPSVARRTTRSPPSSPSG